MSQESCLSYSTLPSQTNDYDAEFLEELHEVDELYFAVNEQETEILTDMTTLTGTTQIMNLMKMNMFMLNPQILTILNILPKTDFKMKLVVAKSSMMASRAVI